MGASLLLRCESVAEDIERRASSDTLLGGSTATLFFVKDSWEESLEGGSKSRAD